MFPRMELEITPEPTPEERAAIEQAIAAALERQPDGGAWWRAGMADLEGEDGGEPPSPA